MTLIPLTIARRSGPPIGDAHVIELCSQHYADCYDTGQPASSLGRYDRPGRRINLNALNRQVSAAAQRGDVGALRALAAEVLHDAGGVV